MKRAALVVLALAAAVPATASAQGVVTDEPLWGPRVRLTPFVGVAPGASRIERWTANLGGQVRHDEYDVDLGAGPAAGLGVEIQVVERFAVIGAGYFVSRGDTRVYSRTASEYIITGGSDFLMAKLAAALRLREAVSEMQLRRLTATAFAGPAFIREMPDDPRGGAFDESLSHWAVNFGFDAEVPIGSGSVALQLGAEDFLTFWNSDEIAARADAANGNTTESSLDADLSNMFVFRVGLTLRFR